MSAPGVAIPVASPSDISAATGVWLPWSFYVAFSIAAGLHALVFVRAIVRWVQGDQNDWNRVTALGGTFATLAFFAIAAVQQDDTSYVAIATQTAGVSAQVPRFLFLALAIIFAGLEIDLVAQLKFAWHVVVGGRTVLDNQLGAFFDTSSHRGPYGGAARPFFGFLLLFAGVFVTDANWRLYLTIFGASAYACWMVYHGVRMWRVYRNLSMGDSGAYRFVLMGIFHTLAQLLGAVCIILGSVVNYDSSRNADYRNAFPALISAALGCYIVVFVASLTMRQPRDEGLARAATSSRRK